MDITALVNITSRAWSLPILAQMNDGTQGRQAPLVAATGAGRTAFAQSMDHLMQIGLVERNPGHGHPLRPEFRLTDRGRQAAAMASRVMAATGAEDLALLRRAWTLPVLTTLGNTSHFNHIRRNLGPITDRALSQSLRLMEDRAWVARRVDATARPPRPLYRAINTGAVISRIAAPHVGFGPPH